MNSGDKHCGLKVEHLGTSSLPHGNYEVFDIKYTVGIQEYHHRFQHVSVGTTEETRKRVSDLYESVISEKGIAQQWSRNLENISRAAEDGDLTKEILSTAWIDPYAFQKREDIRDWANGILGRWLYHNGGQFDFDPHIKSLSAETIRAIKSTIDGNYSSFFPLVVAMELPERDTDLLYAARVLFHLDISQNQLLAGAIWKEWQMHEAENYTVKDRAGKAGGGRVGGSRQTEKRHARIEALLKAIEHTAKNNPDAVKEMIPKSFGQLALEVHNNGKEKAEMNISDSSFENYWQDLKSTKHPKWRDRMTKIFGERLHERR